MASIADLNVRLGLIYSNLDKGLEQVERKLRASGRRLSQLGEDLTLSISLPLAAIGGSAIKAAGDMEALQLAMESQLGSAEAARKEIEALRIEALKPGLGFEQAVRGSLQLQAVGFSAEKARITLSAFGNALALAGKGGAELDGVALALTQIQAKGVVSAEEINQIAERLPQIRSAMKAAFGTASTEEIQKLGITAAQFIDGITKELQKLPQATGGIKNALENAGQGVTQFLAKIGTSISTAFDLPAKAEQFTQFLQAAGDAFSNLDASTQRNIIATGAFIVALGPAIKILGVLKSTGAQVIDTFQGFLGASKSLVNGIAAAAKAFNGLNIAMKLTVIGAAIAAATALYYAYENLANSLSDTELAQQAVNNVTQKASDNIAEERVRAEQLVKILKDQNATRSQQQQALQQLNKISPEYFSKLDLEKSKVEDVDKALQGYIASLLRAAKVQAAQEQLVEIEKSLNNLSKSAAPTTLETVGNALLSIGNAGQFASLQASEYSNNLKQQKSALEAQREALTKVLSTNTDLVLSNNAATGSTKTLTVATEENTKAKKKQRTEVEEYLEKLQQVNQAEAQHRQVLSSMGLQPLETLPAPASAQQIAGTGPVAEFGITQPVEAAANVVSPSEALYEGLRDKVISFDEAFRQTAENVQANGGVMQSALMGVAQSVTDFAASGGTSLKGFVNAIVDGARQAIGAYIRMGVASVVAKSLAKGGANPVAALALGAIAGAGAQVLFNNLLSRIKIPAFAAGTNYAPGGLALVGELGPELVNLPRGSQVLPNSKVNSMLSDNSMNLSGEFTLRGEDLILSLDKARQRQNRYK